MRSPDPTVAPSLRSWLESACASGCPFPIQNLPYGVFRAARSRDREVAGSREEERRTVGVAIGDAVLDLRAAADAGLLEGLAAPAVEAVRGGTLNGLMALEAAERADLRSRLSELLSDDGHREVVEPLLRPQAEVEMLLPAEVGDYTDFYASVHHATNVGSLFRPDNPLLPNYKWIPIGYHGRASSLVVSGTPVRRPQGQRKGPEEATPRFGPCRLLDYELEVGAFVGGPTNALGEGFPLDRAEERIFGLCLVNDWSARDIQGWEYQPLGPFLAKSFATSVSPWVVSREALAPFRCAPEERPEGDPQPLPYLRHGMDEEPGFDLELSVHLLTERMRQAGDEPHELSRTSFRHMYWTLAQMLTHHASNGCPMEPADLIASGTVSGPEAGELGSLLEITRRGQHPVELPNGESRKMLEDGDEVILRGWCRREGAVPIGLGECRGVVLPA